MLMTMISILGGKPKNSKTCLRSKVNIGSHGAKTNMDHQLYVTSSEVNMIIQIPFTPKLTCKRSPLKGTV